MLLLFFISPFSLYSGPRSGHYFRSVFASSFHCTVARDLGVMLFFGFYIASSFQSTVVRDLGMVLVLFCLILDWAG